MIHASSAAGRVYAKALFDIAQDKSTVGRVWDDLEALDKLLHADQEFREFFTSPKVDRQHKIDALKQALGDGLQEDVLRLLFVLVRKGRTPYFNNIVEAFHAYKDGAEHRLHASVTSAMPLTAELRDSINTTLSKRHGANTNIVLHETVDESLVGGMVLRVGDLFIDNSVRTRLNAIKGSLRIEA